MQEKEKSLIHFGESSKNSAENHKNMQIIEKLGRRKNVEVVDLVKSFPTRVWSSKSASIQRRTDRIKFEIEKLTNFDE